MVAGFWERDSGNVGRKVVFIRPRFSDCSHSFLLRGGTRARSNGQKAR